MRHKRSSWRKNAARGTEIHMVMYARILEVRDAKLKGLAVDTAACVVTVGGKVSSKGMASRLVKTSARRKNMTTYGADWTCVVPGEAVDANVLRMEAMLDDDDVEVKFKVYQRLKTEFTESHQLGKAVYVMSKDEISAAQKTPKMLKLDIKTASGAKNGTVSAEVWVKQRESELVPVAIVDSWRYILAGWFFLSYLLCRKIRCGWLVLACCFGWLTLEAPGLVGKALTLILDKAVPGLNLSVAAVRLALTIARQQLVLHVEVDDFRLAHDPAFEFSHEDFVRAKQVKLRLGFDVVDMLSNVAGMLMRAKREPTVESKMVLSARGTHLAAKDKMTGSSDPYFWVLACTPEEIHKAQTERRFDPSGYVQICKSDTIMQNLNPVWQPVSLDTAIVDSKLHGKQCLLAVMDYDVGKSDDLIGVAVVSLKEGDQTVEIFKRGKTGGFVTFAVEFVKGVKEDLPGIAWSPFPSVHDNLRLRTRNFEPTRFGTVSLDLQVDEPTVAFDLSPVNEEFNVNNYVRNLALGKLKMSVKPNLLKISINAVKWATSKVELKSKKRFTMFRSKVVGKCSVVAQLRGQNVNFGTCEVKDGVATGFKTGITIDCADPAAVVRILVKDQIGGLVGHWITTLKMIVLAPANVHGSDLESKSKPGLMSGLMQLRDADFGHPVGACVDMELSWVHDPNGKTHDQIMSMPRRLTALEQLQQNSAETKLKLGNQRQLKHMLKDFPLLFDVQSLQLNRVHFHLKPLFMGFESESKNAKALFLDKVDLRSKLKAKPGQPGVDLYALSRNFVLAAIGPVLAEVSVVDAASHIMSGVFTGLLSTVKASGTIRARSERSDSGSQRDPDDNDEDNADLGDIADEDPEENP